MEERVWRTDIEIADHLLGMVSEGDGDRTREQRQARHELFEYLKQNPGRAVRTLPQPVWQEWSSQERERARRELTPFEREILGVGAEW
jgi:hypothetical protein